MGAFKVAMIPGHTAVFDTTIPKILYPERY